MAKSMDAASEFVKPSSFDALRLELTQLESVEPGSKSVAEAISDLMPLIKGCRDRGHSWNRIALSFQKFIPDLSATTLRRHVYELDPSLKGTVKGVNENGGSGSVLPSLDEDESDVEEQQSSLFKTSSSSFEDENDEEDETEEEDEDEVEHTEEDEEE
ncbi:MAG: hypothetical protein WCA35_13455 [Kovacikia sp.]